MNNRRLVKACKNGNNSARKQLFDDYGPMVKSMAARYASSQAFANDLFQEVFVQIFTSIHQLKNPQALPGWIKRVAITTIIGFNKNLKSHVVDLPFHYDSSDTIDLQQVERIIALLRELPPGYRTIFNLYVIEEYSHKEISELLGIEEGTSRSQLHKAKNYIRRRLKDSNNSKSISKYG